MPESRLLTPGSAGVANDPLRQPRVVPVAGRSSDPLSQPVAAGGLESLIGEDERVRIVDTDLAPWRMICALAIRGASGGGMVGTGWFVGPRTILTAGHCVRSNAMLGGWAASIEVSPGRDGTKRPFGSRSCTRFDATEPWIRSEHPDFDIGCIHLDEPFEAALGWFALAVPAPDELAGYLVNVSGYPIDKGRGTEQYHHRNRVLRVAERRVFYDVDTYGGQSGSPVWIHETEGGPPMAVGIHAYGVSAADGVVANSAPRLIPEVIDQVRSWVAADGGWPGVD